MVVMSTFCFSVDSDPSPNALPRVLDVFALHGLVPDSCHSVKSPAGLSVDLQLSDVAAVDAALLRKRLAKIITVTSVQLFEKRDQPSGSSSPSPSTAGTA